MRASTSIALVLALLAAPVAAKTAPPAATTVAAAVAAQGRSPDNVKLDESRKPAEVLSFVGLKRGMKVIDLFGGNAYWAELEAPVVGPKGHVLVWEPTQFYNDKTKASFAEFMAKNPNVTIVATTF